MGENQDLQEKGVSPKLTQPVSLQQQKEYAYYPECIILWIALYD